MSKLVVLITARIEEGHTIGEAWQQAGAPGVTLIEGHGLRRLQEATQHTEILSGTFSLLEVFRQVDISSLIIFTVLDEDWLVDRILDTTEKILGDLRQANNGIAFVINLERTVGINRY
ncbi:MAG: hypothetical protein HND46_01580 [Chloroflexi bacterium]|nr:hypothetical protein [Chloroflexota bacterium]NOG62083.1 hypothetical protein [Chloroflexota bacterium]